MSFHLDLFIYEWEMVCGFSSVFVSVMKYIRNKVYNGNFNSGYRLGWVIVRGLELGCCFQKDWPSCLFGKHAKIVFEKHFRRGSFNTPCIL